MKKSDRMETGDRYGRLTFLRESRVQKYDNYKKHRYGIFECDCGNIKEIRMDSVWHGRVKGCGCKAGRRDVE